MWYFKEIEKVISIIEEGFKKKISPEKHSGFGYKVWASVGEEFCASDSIDINDFKGGLYAVASATLGKKCNLWETWQMMHRWLEQSEYTYGKHQWLEEHLTISGKGVLMPEEV